MNDEKEDNIEQEIMQEVCMRHAETLLGKSAVESSKLEEALIETDEAIKEHQKNSKALRQKIQKNKNRRRVESGKQRD